MAVVVGLTTGGAYMVGGLARGAVVHAKIARLAGAAEHGFSETALEAAAADPTVDPAILAIARRYDPSGLTDEQAQSQGRLAALAENLNATRTSGHRGASSLLARASFITTTPVIAAEPFNLRGALEESRDLECLTQAVYYEARGEGDAGEAAVAQVVLNRTRHPAFPKTICGVVFQGVRGGGCQFSFACDGSVHRVVDGLAWRRAEKIAARALDGFVMAEVGTATHFHVASLSPNWAGLTRVAQVGAHVFYRFGGRAGANGAFTGEPALSDPETPAPNQPVYASLSLAPLANSVAGAVANSVAGAAAAGAELMMAATAPKAQAATPAAPPAQAATAPSAAPTPVAAKTVEEPIKTASAL